MPFMDDLNGNVVIIITPEGDLIFQIPEEELGDDQFSVLMRMSAVVKPSLMLSTILTIEIALTHLNMNIQRLWAKIKGRNTDE